MTDVLGYIVSMIPLLIKVGVKYLHIGVKLISVVSEVAEMFVWESDEVEQNVVHYYLN